MNRTHTAALVLVVCLTLLTGCRKDWPKPPPELQPTISARQLVADMAADGIPVGRVTVFDAATDPARMLGAPGQYTSKALFEDARIPDRFRVGGTDNPSAGGIVEVWPDAQAAEIRAQDLLVDNADRDSPRLREWVVTLGPYLIRLSTALDGPQRQTYRDVLHGIHDRMQPTLTARPDV